MSRPHRRPGVGATAPASWEEIQRRIRATTEALQSLGTPTAAERTAILKARARALAAPLNVAAPVAPSLEIIEFLLAHERYGVESAFVREVYPMTDLTPLPCTPPFVLGIISVRGQVLSVLDIKKFFDLPEQGLTDLNKVIILRSDAMMFGILADAVIGVRNVAPAELQASVSTLTGIREEYLKGVTADRVAILHAAKLLSDRNIVVHEDATG